MIKSYGWDLHKLRQVRGMMWERVKRGWEEKDSERGEGDFLETGFIT